MLEGPQATAMAGRLDKVIATKGVAAAPVNNSRRRLVFSPDLVFSSLSPNSVFKFFLLPTFRHPISKHLHSTSKAPGFQFSFKKFAIQDNIVKNILNYFHFSMQESVQSRQRIDNVSDIEPLTSQI